MLDLQAMVSTPNLFPVFCVFHLVEKVRLRREARLALACFRASLERARWGRRLASTAMATYRSHAGRRALRRLKSHAVNTMSKYVYIYIYIYI